MTLDEINQKLQQTDTAIQSLKVASASPPPTSGIESWWSVTNAMTMSTVVLVFGLLVILLATYLIKAGKNTEAVLRIFGTILPITLRFPQNV